MSLPRTMAAALAALMVASVLPLLQPGEAAAAGQVAATPLTVELTELTPSTIPAKGRIVLAGTVRNDSDEIWSAINVHPFVSGQPMTEREQLTSAASSDPGVEVGDRLIGPGQFDPIGDLVPGQGMPFRISLKVKDLHLSAPGVYWIGVHALGDHAAGREVGGRARTFIPLVAPDATTSVSLVFPLRERVRRDRVGRLLDTTAWSTTLGDDGRLERIAALLSSAGGVPATMLVDPAVIDAVGSVAADNPELSLGEAAAGQPTSSPSDGGSPTADPSRSFDRLGPSDRANAARWLAQVKQASSLQTVLGLGYADPDIASLARRRPPLLNVAAKESAAAFKRLGVDALPTVAPASGWLDDAALGSIPADTMVLVSDHAAPRTRTQWRTPEQQDLVFTDAQAAAGGPGPTPALDALEVRQRIVSDAALRRQPGSTGPMVVELPDDWDPGANWQAADFFGGLDLPWLDLVQLGRAPVESTPTFDAALGYPAAERRAEVGLVNVSAARLLVSTASVAGQLLRSTNDVQRELTGIALSAVSYHARRDQTAAREGALAANQTMRDRLDKVSVVGTDFVTLSGGSGTLTVTLVNQLDQPITVGIRPTETSPDVHIQTPKPLDMAPGQRTVLRLKARASSIGVHEVTLTPVTAEGAALGTPLTFNLRTSQVGKLIWGVLLGAGGLLVVMILRRIRRGLREHRWRGQ
ncbi:hypothetical protein ACVW00_004117 [Marmoricola sp. URHA0025 HA25]